MTSLHPAQHLTFSRRSAAALAAAVLFLAGCGEEAKTTAADAAAASKTTPAQQAPIPVGVVQLVEHEALDATVKGFIDELAARGLKTAKTSALITKMRRVIRRPFGQYRHPFLFPINPS